MMAKDTTKHVRFELVDHVTQQSHTIQTNSLRDAKIEAERAFNKTGNPQVLRKVTISTVYIVER